MTSPATSVRANPPGRENLLLPVATLVVWAGCAAISGLGWALPYARARLATKPEPAPVTVQVVPVKLTMAPTAPARSMPAVPALAQPPALPEAPPPPAAPPLTVAEPSPQIAFAVPVAAPARIDPVQEASYRTPEPTPATAEMPVAPVAPPAPQPLTFGVGEGRQALPEYPREARRLGQEGTVTVRLTVGENGRVLAAEATEPSPWPLLNNAALRTVRQRWQFAAGPVRHYDIAIRFQLSK